MNSLFTRMINLKREQIEIEANKYQSMIMNVDFSIVIQDLPLDVPEIDRMYINKLDYNTMKYIESKPYIIRQLCYSKRIQYNKI